MTATNPAPSGKIPKPRQPERPLGDFPKAGQPTASTKTPCSPEKAGLLARLYTGRHKGHVVKKKKIEKSEEEARKSSKDLENSFAKEIAKILASGSDLPDWERRLTGELKQHFAMLALGHQPNAHAISIRLDHKTAEAALSAPKSPTDYLSAILRNHGIKDMAFCLEFSDTESDENHPLHLHGIAIIPADQPSRLANDLRKAMASDYRQRYKNQAIDIQPISTPGTWTSYCSKNQQSTARQLKSSPVYASQSAKRAGKRLYEGIRAWVRPKTPRKTS